MQRIELEPEKGREKKPLKGGRFIVLLPVKGKKGRTIALRDAGSLVLSWRTRKEAEKVAKKKGGEVFDLESA